MTDLYRDYIREHDRRPQYFGVNHRPVASYHGRRPLLADRRAPASHPPCPTWQPVDHRSTKTPMPRTYADLLREARSQIREVTPNDVSALPDDGATVIDVREDSEWEQGHLPNAVHISK